VEELISFSRLSDPALLGPEHFSVKDLSGTLKHVGLKLFSLLVRVFYFSVYRHFLKLSSHQALHKHLLLIKFLIFREGFAFKLSDIPSDILRVLFIIPCNLQLNLVPCLCWTLRHRLEMATIVVISICILEALVPLSILEGRCEGHASVLLVVVLIVIWVVDVLEAGGAVYFGKSGVHYLNFEN
jgi:hypothetical protein